MLAKHEFHWSKLANLQIGANTAMQAGQFEAPTYDAWVPGSQIDTSAFHHQSYHKCSAATC